MDFSKVTNIVIPEGRVTQIAEKKTGRILWGNAIAAGVILTAVDASSPVVVKTETTDGTQYRVNNGAWTHYDTVTTLSARKIAIRCVGKTTAHLMNTAGNRTGVQDSSGKFKLSGHIADLLDWKKRLKETITYGNSCFVSFLSGCTTVTDISELIFPDTVSESMWNEAFRDCTALENGFTKLPAKTLAAGCYAGMFQGCTALKKAPEIMAEDLAGEMNKSMGAARCFQRMFYNCKALESLSQTKFYFTIGTYMMCESMFEGCTSLKKGLDLSNITSCYTDNIWNASNNMFYEMYCGCTALTDAGKLPATYTLYRNNSNMFYRMFKNCESLTTAPDFPEFKVDNSFDDLVNIQKNSTSWMFAEMYYGCKSLKTLPNALAVYPARGAAEAANNWTRAFAGCTSITEVPDSYFEKFCAVYGSGTGNNVKGDFEEAFSGCTGLTKIGKIFGSNYAANGGAGYIKMFYGCTNLASMPTDAWLFVGGDATSMFENCSSLKTIQGVYLGSTNDNTSYIDACSCTNMFKGCTSLTSATFDTTKVYYLGYNKTFASMFENDTALTTVTMNLDSLTEYSYASEMFQNMFNCCKSLKEIPFVLPSIITKLGNYACNAMFGTCTSLTKIPDDFFGGVTTVGSNCCESMFSGCTSLTSVPTSLLSSITSMTGDSSYAYMFAGCTSLVKLPKLPYASVVASAYKSMFEGCTSIMLSETKTDEYAIEFRVPSTGTMDTSSGMNSMLTSMFGSTGGPWKGEPTANKTYYLRYYGMVVASESKAAITFTYRRSTASLQIATDVSTDDDSKYNSVTTDTAMTVSGGVLYIRGTGNSGLGNGNGSNSIFNVVCSANDVVVSGRLEGALDHKKKVTTLLTGAFANLFMNMTSIKDVSSLTLLDFVSSQSYYYAFAGMSNITETPDLSKIATMDTECFKYMFYNATKLTTISELPSTKLAYACYMNMLQGTALVTAPELPATTYANYCYNGMFRDCTKLTTPPSKLPMTTVGMYSYAHMFNGCTALTTAPDLPATTMNSEGGYYDMFNECTSLTKPPKISARNISSKGCYEMFNGCTKLTESAEMSATTLGTQCCYRMYRNCSNLTTAKLPPATTAANECYNSMFMNCISLTTPPAIPITTLAQSCFYSMFNGCKSLTSAPKLPCTKLAVQCYAFMFASCTSLTVAPELPATTLSGWCYYGMFYATRVATAPTLAATSVPEGGYYQMFKADIALTKAPELPATQLGNQAYREMFINCTAMTTPPSTLPATSIGNYVYTRMFYGCSKLATGPSIALKVVGIYGCQQMFLGCTALTTMPKFTNTITSLSEAGMNGMFQSCTSMTCTEFPSIQVTSIPTNGLSYMLNGCTNVKISATQTGNYTKAFRIPSTGTATAASTSATSYMLSGTGGTFKGDSTGNPTLNTTYYLYVA